MVKYVIKEIKTAEEIADMIEAAGLPRPTTDAEGRPMIRISHMIDVTEIDFPRELTADELKTLYRILTFDKRVDMRAEKP